MSFCTVQQDKYWRLFSGQLG